MKQFEVQVEGLEQPLDIRDADEILYSYEDAEYQEQWLTLWTTDQLEWMQETVDEHILNSDMGILLSEIQWELYKRKQQKNND